MEIFCFASKLTVKFQFVSKLIVLPAIWRLLLRFYLHLGVENAFGLVLLIDSTQNIIGNTFIWSLICVIFSIKFVGMHFVRTLAVGVRPFGLLIFSGCS